MSVAEAFGVATAKTAPSPRPGPFSLRLTVAERTRLVDEAAGVPLGTYLKAKALGEPIRTRRTGLSIGDRSSLAKALAMLGRSHLSSNLNQLAKAVNTGSLPLTPETEAELLAAIRDVRAIRILLMRALGVMAESAP